MIRGKIQGTRGRDERGSSTRRCRGQRKAAAKEGPVANNEREQSRREDTRRRRIVIKCGVVFQFPGPLAVGVFTRAAVDR